MGVDVASARFVVGTMPADAVARVGYRVAYWLLRAWWFVVRPATYGAVCALWHDGRVLLVRTSYRRPLTFPGGFRGRNEEPDVAVTREIAEEVGLDVATDELRHVRFFSERRDHRQENTDLFEATLRTRPRPRIDNREVVEVMMLTPAEALAHPLYPPARAYLEGRL